MPLPPSRRLDRRDPGNDQKNRRHVVRLEFLGTVKAADPFDKPGERLLDRGEVEGAEPGDQVGPFGRGNIGWNGFLLLEGCGHRDMRSLDSRGVRSRERLARSNQVPLGPVCTSGSDTSEAKIRWPKPATMPETRLITG